MEPLRLRNAAEELGLARFPERARHVLARFRVPIEEREDLLSETLRIVLQNSENIERREEYALGTLRHLCQQWVGARRAHPTLSLEQDIVPGAKTPPRMRKESSSERRVVVRDLLQKIPARDAALLELHYFGNLTLSELAKLVRISVAAARSRLHRALGAVRRLVRDSQRRATGQDHTRHRDR